MKYIFLLLALTSCTFAPHKTLIKLEQGTCYYEGGDFGGTPSILHCVQAVGQNGFLSCQGSRSMFKGPWAWYACRDSERWEWLDKVVVVDCPTACPTLSDE